MNSNFIFIDNKLLICDKSIAETPQGYLHVEGLISRSGDQEYFAGELQLTDRNPNEVVTLSRSVEEVTSPMSISSFLHMPVTDEHPEGHLVNPSNYNKYGKGTVLDAEPTDSGHVKAKMIIHDSELIEKIKDGKRELSAGYTAELDFSDDGKSAAQKKIRGNHVAFVDSARCGKECRIFDNNPKREAMMKQKIKGVEYEVSDSVSPAIQMLILDSEKAIKELKDSKEESSKLKAMLDAADEKIKKMEDEEDDEDAKEKAVQDAADERLDVLVKASSFLSDYNPKGKTLAEIKRDCLDAALPEVDFKDKEEIYIDTRFDILCEDSGKNATMSDGLSGQMRSTNLSDSENVVKIARDNKMKRSQLAFKGGSK